MAKQDVLLERIENLLKTISSQHIENKEAHQKIVDRLDYTNGKVRSLQIWKGTIIGALSVLIFLSTYFANDYLKNKAQVAQHEKDDAVLIQRVTALEKIKAN